MSTDADELVERIRQGDAEALADVHRGTAHPAAGLRRAQTRVRAAPQARARRRVSGSVGRGHAFAGNGRPAIGREPFGWLCQIAERRIIDAHRRFFGAAKRDAGREVSINKGRADESRAASDRHAGRQHDNGQQDFSRNVSKSD